MKFRLIYPRWKKLERQTEFHLPPHGPVVFAAALPPEWEVEFIDENVEPLPADGAPDIVGISMMLTGQVKRGWEIADEYRSRGVTVICGGIGTMLHAEETMKHADAVFLGEAEGRMGQVFADWQNGRLKPVYDYFGDHPPTEAIGPARRDILKRDLYNYKGIQMVDLVHASRGCRFNCYPCCVSYLGGRQFRPRPVETVIAEMAGIDNNRLFIVDNSLAQDRSWEIELFPRDDPPEEEVVLPSHRGGRRGPGSGRPGRGLVRLPGHLRYVGPHPPADQALPRPRHRRGGDGPLGPRPAHARTASSGSSIFSWRSNWTWPNSPSSPPFPIPGRSRSSSGRSGS